MTTSRLLILIGLAGVLATMTLAQQPVMGPGHPGGPPDPVMGPAGFFLHQLDLSADQRQQVHATVEGALDGSLGTLARSFMEARHALELRIWDPRATDAEIAAASEVVAQRAQALEAARHGLALEIQAILTDEQRAELAKMLAQGPPPCGRGTPCDARFGRRDR
jgi:Spy/CpxP family protein refolding chaperone